MNTFFRITLKQALFAGAIAVVACSILFLHNDVVQGKGATHSAVTNVPLAGAKIVLTKVSGSSAAQASLSTTSAQNGTFTFPAVNADQKGGGMVTYTLTVTPAVTYTITDPKTGTPKATPNFTPVNVSVTFNQLRGLTAGGGIANTGPLGPLTFISSSSLQIGVAFGGVISGTVTKQQ